MTYLPLGLLLTMLSLSGFANVAWASTNPCEDQTEVTLRQACLMKAIGEADEQLNIAYQRQLRNAPESDRPALRAAQRNWLALRNSTCQFNEKDISNRTAWLEAAAKDPKRASCLFQHTINRTRELSPQQAPLTQENGPILFSEVKPSLPESAYAARSRRAHKFGKFYFEVVIDHGSIKRKVEADLQIRLSGGKRYIATTYSIRPQDQVIRMGDTDSITIVGGNLGAIRLPKTVIGVAVDLDSRQFFRHRDGDWRGKPPSLGVGLAIPVGEQFFAEVVSSVSIASLIGDSVLALNFGEKPFAYPPPAGYVAFDGESLVSGSPASSPPFSLAARDASIGGLPLTAWIQRYWQWTRSFPKNETPSDDSSGARCNAGQTGEVFFLTGSRQTTPVSRTCSIPRGRYVFIPLINVLAQVNLSSQATCDDLLRPVRQVNESAADLSIVINGQAIQSPISFKAESGCFELRDTSQSVSGRAAGAGYWVVLNPLETGNYEIRFSGRYRADGFTQSVQYQLRVE